MLERARLGWFLVIAVAAGCSDDHAALLDAGADSAPAPRCGDGATGADEACDDGNAIDGDGCDHTCKRTACGNGVVTTGEVCDDGNAIDGDGCDTNCRPSGCGNGIVTAGEACDDGNAIDGDGCDVNCTATACGNGIPTAGEACDDGNAVDGDGCDVNCTATACGNGIASGGEACDDGNATDGDGCDVNCTATACGNGIVTAGEACDDANADDYDLCDATCARAAPELLYYRFDETGTSVTNLASAPVAGSEIATLVGAATQGGAGVCHGALIGTGGTADALDTHWITELTGLSWTISFWSTGVPQATSPLAYVFGDPSAGALRCFTGGVAGAGNWILRGPVNDVLVPGGASTSLQMTTFVYDAAAGQIFAYLDGALVTTVAQGAPTITGARSFQVGAYDTSPGLPAGAGLDELRLYSRALSAAQVADMFARTSICH